MTRELTYVVDLYEKYAELAALETDRLLTKNTNSSPTNPWARLDTDPVLDRYSNIHPWANNRVHLKVPEGCNDYINASPVSLVPTASKQSDLTKSTEDKYICMQGPKKETVDHTWHMLWHELAEPYETTPAVIIMLSPTHAPNPYGAGTFEKCYPYYPVDENSEPLIINETGVLGDEFHAEVRFVSREAPTPGSTVEVRQFAMSVLGQTDEKPIWHFLYPSWPDFGALEEKNLASIISLMQLSKEKNGRAENPRIVHCSAGVGRTGTFIALEFLINELQSGAWEGCTSSEDPIYDTINQLRMQRRTMVQAFEQYVFLYEVMKKMWQEKYNASTGENHENKESPVDQPQQAPPYEIFGVDGGNNGGIYDEENDAKPNGIVDVCTTSIDNKHKAGEKCGSVECL